MDVDPGEATQALEAMRQSRERLAAAVDCPPARHVIFGLLMGGLVASQAAPPAWTLACEAVLMVGVALVYLWDRRRTGMFVNGYRAGRTRAVTAVILLLTLGLGALGVWLKHGRGLVWGPLACGAVAAVLDTFGSVLWQRVYVRELKQTP
jgi:uncharacterized membrane protein YhfC